MCAFVGFWGDNFEFESVLTMLLKCVTFNLAHVCFSSTISKEGKRLTHIYSYVTRFSSLPWLHVLEHGKSKFKLAIVRPKVAFISPSFIVLSLQKLRILQMIFHPAVLFVYASLAAIADWKSACSWGLSVWIMKDTVMSIEDKHTDVYLLFSWCLTFLTAKVISRRR